jgi:plastocyanin
MKQKLLILVSLLVLLVLFISLRPTPPNAPQTEKQTAEKRLIPTGQKNVFMLQISENKIVAGPSVIKVKQGDQVTLNVISKEEHELHLHGYDKSIDLEPNKQATLSFTANLSGRFVYELEDSQTDIGAMEVSPK